MFIPLSGAKHMPIYYFHVTEGSEVFPALEGVEHSDLAAVQKSAFEGASGLIAEAVKRGELAYHGSVDVDDRHGRRVLTLRFGCPIQLEIA
jgi:hypothetical protein